jgi:hypothetical protein
VQDKKEGSPSAEGLPFIQVTVAFISEHYGMRRVLTIKTMTAMTRIAPTTMTTQSK